MFKWEKLKMDGFKPERRGSCQGVNYKEKMIFFGGMNDENNVNDVLEYDPLTNNWKTIHQGTVCEQKKQKKNKEIIPDPSSGHSLTLFENKLYLIGGIRENAFGSYSFDLITKKWKKLNTFDKKIYFHSTVLAEGDLYIFGGDTQMRFENKLSKVQLSHKNKNQNKNKNKNKNKKNNQNKKEKENKNNKEKEPNLIELKTHGDVPEPTSGHCSFYWGGYLYIFGGTKSHDFTQNQCVYENNDLYRIDLESLIWEKVETSGDKPNPRRSFVSEIRDDKFYIFGGVNSVLKYYNDLYMLDLRTCKWSFIETTGNVPCKRAAMVSAIIRGKLYIAFGCYGKAPNWVDLSDCYSLQLPHLASDDLSVLFSSGKFSDLKICDIPIHSSLVQTRVGGKEIFNKLLQISNHHKYKKNKALISNKMYNLLFWIYTDHHQELAKLVSDEFNLQICFNNRSLKRDLITLSNSQDSMDFTIIIISEKEEKNENKDENENENDNGNENKKIEHFETLKVHKWMLCARSNLYRSLFSTISNISQVKDYSRKSINSLSKLIEFFYHDKIHLTADDNLEVLHEELNDAVNYYQLDKNSNLNVELEKIFGLINKKK
ncbi:acyl-coa-binding domain-containing protein [Anaeramoeba flamelloides]|uniref:Acyl-coa-binding domain-containing protein n=1 Tax=Anaeramoeba flamelloides TaxID=1746091 RepID=A0AAV7YPR2_9EUKA|nr:acyl-coa-binding domain-containing protein [Anaeramoeba flamelloides]